MRAAARRRAVFVDVDGTLMADGHHIPPSALDAIRTARARGHLVFLSTGRGMAELAELMPLGFDGAVTNGGGFAGVGEEIIVSRLMTADQVAHLERYFTAGDLHWYLQSYDRIFASPGLPALMQTHLEHDRAVHAERARAAGLAPDEVRFFSLGMKEFDDTALYDPTTIAKAVFLSDDPARAERAVRKLSEDFHVVTGTIPLPFGAAGEVSPKGVTKGAAILDLLAHLEIDPADAIAIGDNWNDIEMFQVCGTSIAMGNAVPAVQALADEVTASIDDDGLWKAFRRHGLA